MRSAIIFGLAVAVGHWLGQTSPQDGQGTATLAEVTIRGDAPSLPLERLASAFCETGGNVALPCVPAACEPTYCEEWVETRDGLICLDSDELFPVGHFALYDAQEDDSANGPSISALVEY